MIDLQAIDTLYERHGRLSQGRLLNTRQTAKWSKEQREQGDYEERRRVFAYFTAKDEGRSREFIAEFREPSDAEEFLTVYNAWPAIREELLRSRRLVEAVKRLDTPLEYYTSADAAHIAYMQCRGQLLSRRDAALREYEEEV